MSGRGARLELDRRLGLWSLATALDRFQLVRCMASTWEHFAQVPDRRASHPGPGLEAQLARGRSVSAVHWPPALADAGLVAGAADQVDRTGAGANCAESPTAEQVFRGCSSASVRRRSACSLLQSVLLRVLAGGRHWRLAEPEGEGRLASNASRPGVGAVRASGQECCEDARETDGEGGAGVRGCSVEEMGWSVWSGGCQWEGLADVWG